ncbi:MAG: acyl-CoA dehydrogenase, partial [Flavobacteriaceae bacterium]|nr:acyl-CoA dehydrogenase [Flavobacteriaceae bacterium]
MSFYFTEEHDFFRKSFRDFLQKEVVPHIEKWEETGHIERFIWEKFGEMGYFGINYPEKYGGMDLDLFYTVIFLEELQRVNSGGFAAAMWAHAYLAMTHLNKEGNHKQKEKYLAPSITGEKIGCLCITEPFGGSDVGGMRSTAVKKGDSYIINGSKTFITNGVYSDYLIVAAKTSPELGNKGISIFVVDRDTPGISATKLDKLGWRASDTGEIAFDNVEIPVGNLMGEENKGFPYIMQHFALERLIMGINAHARSEWALEYTIQYMKDRVCFVKPISQFQALRHKIADLTADLDVCKTYNYVTT